MGKLATVRGLRVLVAIATMLVSSLAFGAPPTDRLTPPPATWTQWYNEWFRKDRLPPALPPESTPPTADKPGILRVRRETIIGDLEKNRAAFAAERPLAVEAGVTYEKGYRILDYGRTGGPVASMLKHSGAGPQIYNFAIDTNDQIFLGVPMVDGVKTPHPTLLGGDVLSIEAHGAGQVLVRNGKIVEIDLQSGHFKPGPEFIRQILAAFKKLPPETFEGGKAPEFVVDMVGGRGVPVKAPPAPEPMPTRPPSCVKEKAPPSPDAPKAPADAPEPAPRVASGKAAPTEAPPKAAAPAARPAAVAEAPAAPRPAAPVHEASPTPRAPVAAAEVTPATRVATHAEVPAAPRSGAGSTPTPKGAAIPGAAPSMRAQVTSQGLAGGAAILGTAAGKIVEHETGSPVAGTATTVTIATGTTVVGAKLAGQSVVKTVGVGTGAALAGMAARAGTQYVTGSETAGDLAGFGAAAATGAAFGGPVGAVGGVVIHGASELTGAGIDYYYARKYSIALDEGRKYMWIHHAYGRALGRAPTEAELKAWKWRIDRGLSVDRLTQEMSTHGQVEDVVNAIYKHHFGSEATPAQLAAARTRIAHFGAVSTLEEDLIEAKRSYAYILNRKPSDAEVAAFVAALDDHRGYGREYTLVELRKGLANSLESGELVEKIYQAQLGRLPTAAELAKARELLAAGTSAFDLERQLTSAATK